MKKLLVLSLAVLVGFVAISLGSEESTDAYVRIEEMTDVDGIRLKEGDLISASRYGDPDIYIIKFAPVTDLIGYGELPDIGSSGYKRLFLNPAIFNFYGHLGGFKNVHQVTPRIRDAFTTSGIFRNCEINDPTVWAAEVLGEDGALLHHVQITGDQAVAQNKYFFHKVFCINTNEYNWYPKSSTPYTSLSQIPSYYRYIPTPTPTPTYTPNIFITPTITSVSVRPSYSNPQVMTADINGYLPTPCYTLGGSNVNLGSNNTIYVTLMASAPTSTICAQVIQPFTRSLDLDAGPIMAAGTYSLYINSQHWTTFTKTSPTPTPTPTPLTIQVWRSQCAIVPACSTFSGSTCTYQSLPADMTYCPVPKTQVAAVGVVNSSASQSGDTVTLTANLTMPSCYKLINADMTWQNSAVNLVPELQYDSSYCGVNNPVALTYIFSSRTLSYGSHTIHTNGYTNSLGQFWTY